MLFRSNTNPMSSAPSVRPYPLQATPSAMKAGIPPSSIPMPPSGLPLVSSPSGLATPTHLTPLMALPSPSVFQTPLSSPGLAPPSPHPNACKPESPIAHTRRAARTPPMLVRSTPAQHTLAVRLPEGLAPEMVTISAKKGARLAVVADLWHREDDCECFFLTGSSCLCFSLFYPPLPLPLPALPSFRFCPARIISVIVTRAYHYHSDLTFFSSFTRVEIGRSRGNLNG